MKVSFFTIEELYFVHFDHNNTNLLKILRTKYVQDPDPKWPEKSGLDLKYKNKPLFLKIVVSYNRKIASLRMYDFIMGERECSGLSAPNCVYAVVVCK